MGKIITTHPRTIGTIIEHAGRLPRKFIFMEFAKLWSMRSTCKRLQVGAVIADSKLRTVLGIGYNGPARGLSNDRCRDSVGSCGCIHAEMNAVSQVDSSIPDKVMFVTTGPCELCAQLIIQNNITTVYYWADYRQRVGVELLESVGIVCVDYKSEVGRLAREE